ncbi:dienelactone hydrolase [Colletotrichum orchidophilum]|uniref:Dienelactone hydrolase n=1 Tax=Colletotrichum orchidophilum TaxID=1209926 RepID=A0A1G4BCW8_9PEZI|nr:dienelactone hydrolase [Colletotrichum orchidophilum]OHE99207.1 dienelactone hydrolase [Colletotrichum orchidophilum]
MLIKESHVDVPTKADGKDGSMSSCLPAPVPVPHSVQQLNSKNANQESSSSTLRFRAIPKREITSAIFQFHGISAIDMLCSKFPGVCLFSEIYQVTGPVARFARQIAGQGYIVAAPSSYHDFTGPEALAYDVPGTDKGNAWKVEKTLESYDEDSRRTVDYLLTLPTCTGKIGSTGMCLGGHLAVRASVRSQLPLPNMRPPSHPQLSNNRHKSNYPSPKLDPRISSCVAYFATDIHSRTLGPHTAKNISPTAPENSTHTLDLFATNLTHAEVAMIFGVKDTHVPPEGRDLIRAKLREAGVTTSFYEFAWAQHAFIRDELSKGRYDPAITKVCFEILLELFGRTLKLDLGPLEGVGEVEHVC